MKKLLKWHDAYTLKILVSILLLFTALYPKLPSIHIERTWVYVRMEDFLIFGTVFVWFVQLVRRKVSIPKVFAAAIGSYWIVGLISLWYSITYIAPTLSNFFPHVAALSYIRRIEYMILFFVAFSTIRTKKDIRDYFIVLTTTVGLISLYGLGQRYYVVLWAVFPKFFQNNPFCFPSFQTGNEEFAKGIPLCLPPGGRTTSTFGGSYDLGAYMAMVLPIIVGVFMVVKRLWLKIITFLVFISGLMVLIFTAQRAAFIAYLIGGIFTLFIYKRKIYIIPLVIISIVSLSIFSESTAKRFLSTFRVSSIVTNAQGEVVGEALPADLAAKFQKPKGGQYLPEGSAYIGLPQEKAVATDKAYVKRTLTPQEARRLRLADGTLQLSTVTGSFLVRKVLVYDISFTTRFQAEWPNAIKAYERNPLLGSGYSTITLATDNDYLRALGETGILGLLSFLGIFLILWITLKKLGPPTKPSITAGFTYGLAGGVLALLANAVLIDVFEASKVAETLWILLGIGAGGLLIHNSRPFSYWEELRNIFTTQKALAVYLITISTFAFLSSTSNFFVGDDFTWLKWTATDSLQNLPNHFLNAQGFFYRPLDKIITFFLYTLFSFQPQGYHIFVLFLHILSTIAVYALAKKILNSKSSAFFAAILFALHPIHSENILWFSGLSGVLSSLFILCGMICYMWYKKSNSIVGYIATFFLTALAFMSYEIAVIAPLIYIAVDKLLFKSGKNKNQYFWHIPFLLLIPFYYLLRIFSNTFQGGGDYSYNIFRAIPNVIGNFFGYIGMFLFGHEFLSIYASIRNNLRSQSKLITFLALILIIALLFFVFKNRKKIVNYFNNQTIKKIIFGIVFTFLSLLPFLPLGNIAPRYLYLGSFGLCLVLIISLKAIADIISPTRKKIRILILTIFVFGIAIWYQTENLREQENWRRAGEITSDTLAFLRVEYPRLNSRDNIYFVNTPIKHNNAWVFPVGLVDGMWFMYRDNTPSIYQFNSVEDARKAAKEQEGKNYIFMFDKNENIYRVK